MLAGTGPVRRSTAGQGSSSRLVPVRPGAGAVTPSSGPGAVGPEAGSDPAPAALAAPALRPAPADYEWRGHSFGVQGAVDHFKAADAVTLAGVDIYHPGEDRLTGHEIGFGGDVSRSLKGGAPYLVVETQAQGQMGWLP